MFTIFAECFVFYSFSQTLIVAAQATIGNQRAVVFQVILQRFSAYEGIVAFTFKRTSFAQVVLIEVGVAVIVRVVCEALLHLVISHC